MPEPNTLIACPHCGKTRHLAVQDVEGFAMLAVHCAPEYGGYSARGPMADEADDAIEAWNRRVCPAERE